eukprot:1155402-Pelagomonas_calceolata.AAC.9
MASAQESRCSCKEPCKPQAGSGNIRYAERQTEKPAAVALPSQCSLKTSKLPASQKSLAALCPEPTTNKHSHACMFGGLAALRPAPAAHHYYDSHLPPTDKPVNTLASCKVMRPLVWLRQPDHEQCAIRTFHPTQTPVHILARSTIFRFPPPNPTTCTHTHAPTCANWGLHMRGSSSGASSINRGSSWLSWCRVDSSCAAASRPLFTPQGLAGAGDLIPDDSTVVPQSSRYPPADVDISAAAWELAGTATWAPMSGYIGPWVGLWKLKASLRRIELEGRPAFGLYKAPLPLSKLASIFYNANWLLIWLQLLLCILYPASGELDGRPAIFITCKLFPASCTELQVSWKAGLQFLVNTQLVAAACA